MTVTPEALAAALADPAHHTVADACRSLGITRQAIHAKHRDGRPQRPDLRAVLAEHNRQKAAASAALDRNEYGKARSHCLGLDAATLARLDANGKRRRSATARALIMAALGNLPPPEDAGPVEVVLDLGPAWDAVGEELGTEDPYEIAGRVRGILAR